MTQVTDEMVRASVQAARRYARDVMGVACEVDDPTMRAALEAALAVRKPIDADIGEIIGTLRSWAAALDIPSGPFANEDISASANLIERQAEEIAELKRIKYCGISWRGHTVFGDSASIDAVKSAIHAEGTIPAFRERVQQEQATRAHLTTERDKLIEALRPFARYAAVVDDDTASSPTGDLCPLSLNYERLNDGRSTSLGDCRRARVLLERLGARDGG